MAAPVYVKGGVWSNLEDQILKAAVSKYGTHQWSKIASLLQKKSSRQCEIRWEEYLKPSLNFSRFSRDEDIKLLNLARRLPNQWRTISSMLNRPAQICIERYNKLMLRSDDDIKTEEIILKHGDINPNADTQVALPDKEELDDDEKEMLAEAKIRLLATQGKKATRKIRERMLDESKRIAQLQKRREMKQAGLSSKFKRSRRKYPNEIDYNVEIPYEQEPLPGIYDTSKEDERMMRELIKFENIVMKRGLKEEEPLPQKKKQKKTEKKVDTILPQRLVVNKSIRPKLNLSSPGSKDSISHEILLSHERDEIINNRHVGSVLATQNIKLSNDNNIIGENKDTEFDKFMKKRQLMQLFTMLPVPKNDFDIIVSDDESVKDSSEGEVDDLVESEEEDTIDEDIILTLPSMIQTELPMVSFKTNPQDEYDMIYNEILLKIMKQEDFKITAREYVNYNKVGEEIDKMVRDKPISVSTEAEISASVETDIKTLQQDIKRKTDIVSSLQSNLDYIRPLIDNNTILSNKLTQDKLPRLSALQAEYFVKYKIYHRAVKDTGRRQR